MSGADWRQQQEIEEEQWEYENPDVFEFVQGQQDRKEMKPMKSGCSESYKRGWIAQFELELLTSK